MNAQKYLKTTDGNELPTAQATPVENQPITYKEIEALEKKVEQLKDTLKETNREFRTHRRSGTT